MELRSHTFLGMTQSLCPECLTLVPAKIIVRDKRVYFRKTCPTHGVREDFVCSDVDQFDRMEFSVPGRLPEHFGTDAAKGCPYDCGLCTEHEQHTCIGLVEITSSCNLKCPMCYASSGPAGTHLTFEEAKSAIDRLVKVEGRPEVLQLSGGEPTIHPEFARILEYACAQPIDIVMVNTNGIRIAHDAELVATLARFRKRIEIYLQFDGFSDDSSKSLRGEALLATKLRAVEILGEHRLNTILVATLQTGVNEHEIGEIVKFGVARRWITGVSLQPATYSGRHVLPDTLENRITFPDVIRAIAVQTDGMFLESDFLPLPCAHPNCHSLTYAYRGEGVVLPLTRFIDAKENMDLLANGITFTRPRARQLIERYLNKLGCCGGNCDPNSLAEALPGGVHREGPNLTQLELGQTSQPGSSAAVASIADVMSGARLSEPEIQAAAQRFFAQAMAEQLDPADVFRVTITSFLDAYNFDVRRLMKCCIHHVLPSGHVIPFCAYNVLYRNGEVALPPLKSIP